MSTDWPEFTTACIKAMQAAKESPGRYGGRYVGRNAQGEFVVLPDDDPDVIEDPELDIMAQATPNQVYGIGHVRNYLQADGTVTFPK
jgi:hypothetical protein